MALLANEVSSTLMRVHVLLQVICLQEVFVAFRTLNPSFMCVGEHVLLQVVLSDERPVAEVTLELLRTSVDEHV